MEVLRLILKVISTIIMTGFGVSMIAVGIYEIKQHIPPKCMSIILVADGIFTIALVIRFLFW